MYTLPCNIDIVKHTCYSLELRPTEYRDNTQVEGLDKHYMHDMSGKRLALVLAVMMYWTSAAHAETPEIAGVMGSDGLSGIAAPSSDILGIGMNPFGIVKIDEAAPVLNPAHEPGIEETLLNRWKEKQSERWAFLPKGKFEINASAYTAAADECGKSNGKTASGLLVRENRTLACPSSYPFGAKIFIDGYGTYRCEDRGGAIKGNHFDIYMRTKSDAFAFGRRTLMAEVVQD